MSKFPLFQIKRIALVLFLSQALFLSSCFNSRDKKFTLAFLDAFEDETIAQAKKGFFVALKDSGYIPEQNIRVLYRNAQGDIPALTQSVDFFLTSGVDLIVANTTLSTISAVKKTKSIPICMIVSGSTELTGLRDKSGKDPENLFGVYETLEYIDIVKVSGMKRIKKAIPPIFSKVSRMIEDFDVTEDRMKMCGDLFKKYNDLMEKTVKMSEVK
jgi:putative ABC transport system substrate-binding protein